MKRMADIYTSATKVVIWLGPESDDSVLGLGCVIVMASKVIVDWGVKTITAITEDLHWADTQEEPHLSHA